MNKKWKKPKYYKMIRDLYKTKYGWRVTCPDNLNLGKNTDIGTFTYINARYGVEIGDYVQIGSHCAIYSHDTERDLSCKIIIGNYVLIGSHVTILPRRDLDIFYIFENIKAGSVIY